MVTTMPGQHHAVGKGQDGEGVGFERLGHEGLQGVTCDVQATTYGGIRPIPTGAVTSVTPGSAAKGPSPWKARAWKRSPMRW